ncbi:sugar kinase [Photobacterium japonica]|uniref:sugar kinase n=1 Tax=Photobacterium japonica TaxID=2910235 RepID=UPI003D0A0605
MEVKKIAVIGECMVEIQSQQLGRGFGGDTMNTAIYVSRVGAMPVEAMQAAPEAVISASYFSAFGQNAISQEIIDQCAAQGVDMSHVLQLADKNVGLYLIETDPDGERRFSYWRDNSAARFWLDNVDDEALYAALSQFDMIYLSGITLGIQSAANVERLLGVLSRLRAIGKLICFDSNYRPALWCSPAETQSIYNAMYALTDMALLTHDDEALLFGDESAQVTAERVAALGVKEVVVKCGAEACRIHTHGQVIMVAPQPVNGVIDTTAAGDAFNAGYLAYRLKGYDETHAARAGHRLAGTVITHRGAIIPMSAMPDALLPTPSY